MLANCTHYIDLTVTTTSLSLGGAVTDIPIPCDMPADFQAILSSDAEIRVTKVNDTQLAHGVEDSTAGVVHFNADTVAQTGDTVFRFQRVAGGSTTENKAGVPTSGTVLYLPLSDAGNPVDWSASGNDGTNFGGVTTGVTGKIANAFTFDGGDDYTNVGDDGSLDMTANIAAFAWIKAGVSTGAYSLGILARYDTNAQRSWAILHNGGSTQFTVVLSDDGTTTAGHRKIYDGSIAVFDSTWHHIGFTFDGTDLTLYVDGAADENPTRDADDAIVALHNSTADASIANYFDSGVPRANYFFDGNVDEVQISNTCSADYVKLLANAYPASAIYSWGALQTVGARRLVGGSLADESPLFGALVA